MNEREANKIGFHFIGPVINAWANDKELLQWNGKIAIARAIRKKYKNADFRIVTGTAMSWLSKGSKGIYGNEIFKKVWEEEAYHHTQDRLDNYYDNRLKELKEEYEQKVADLTTQKEKDLAFLEELKALRK